jgi:PAS domain S-box-containing protein
MTLALPDITVQTQIYESANSLVYRGIRRSDKTAVILKVLKQNYPTTAELIRYKQEYEITRSLDLKGVIKAYSQQDYQRTLVIILEDFGGDSLQKLRESREISYPMSLAEFLRLAIAITDILGRIHAVSVIHKDINPSNIVLNPQTGIVKIIDFGIATRLTRTNPTFKNPHVLEGTLVYMSPEQTGRMNRTLDYRTDFYSLGVTFYELLTGRLPFLTMDVLELVHCHIAKQPIPVHQVNLEVPPIVSAIVMKLMAKNAEERYQSAWGIKADLEECLKQLERGDAPEEPLRERIKTFPLGLHDISDKFQIPQKLYGRETEIEALLTAFERVATINERQSKIEMMLVAGYSGIGKSSLVHEIYKPITEKCGYFISGKFDQFRRNIPYSAVVDAFQELVKQLLSESETQLQRWREKLLTALGVNGQVIIDVIPEVESIVGKQPAVPNLGATESQNRFNRVFQNFIRVFCDREHPLVIFLDDLQWVDSATLKLIELIMSDRETEYLFLIGAYRDNEVNPTHPLMMMLEELKRAETAIAQITLAPLELEAIARLIAETLHSDTNKVKPLTELVMRKTGGNPFFVNEFLKTLYAENLITFNLPDNSQFSSKIKNPKWTWDIAEIEAKKIADNVVELTIAKLKKLPNSTQQVLQLAACVGADFDLTTLSIICEKSPHEIFPDLVESVQSGLILPVSELDVQLLIQNYKFLHDRVQQAAYALIDESHQQIVHLQIGRNLLKKTLPERRSERLFEIVDHLNHGIELVSDRLQRDEIAKLNLLAGQKAKAAMAYEAAFKYFNTGLKLLDVESWQREYDLTLALYSEAAEAAYLSGHFDEMERLVEVVLNRAKTVLDTVKVYDSRIQAWMSRGDPKEALRTGLEVLQLLGIRLVEAPSQLDIQAGLEETASRLAGWEIEDLIDLPEMTEPVPLAAIYILASTLGSTYSVSPALLVLIVCKMVNLSIAHGNAIWSLLGYAAYGMTLCGVVQDFELGYRFGKLSLNLAKRSNNKGGNCKALTMVNSSIIYWKAHLKETLPSIAEAYQSGIESGEFEYASYCAVNVCYYSFYAGQQLTELEQQTAIYCKATHQIRRETPATYLAMLQQTILNLRGQSENPSRLVGCLYDKEQALSWTISVNDGTSLHWFYSNKLILCYLFGEYEQAAKTATLAKPYLSAATGLMSVAVFHFYDSLIVLSLLANASNSEKEAWLNRVNANQEKMQKWAYHAPMNFLHKYHLVEAEKARVLGQLLEAEKSYEQAIQGARENGYIQEEALAYELAAKHYLARDLEKFAQLYMKEARYCYERWGATAKVKDLETRYLQFFSQLPNVAFTPIHTTAGTTSNTPQVAFDLATVMKASVAIACEIELDRLLRSLMQILIENAGAQSGFLILENSGKWAIEAACELNDGDRVCDTQVLRSLPMTNRLPKSIVQYVIRTHESVILNNATVKGNFINDPYIQHHQTQSIFCLPLLNQSKLVGVLYLENQLATGVFTPDRSQVLNLLSTQAAIAIENARLYSKLRESESRMAQFLEAVPVGIAVVDATGRPYYFNQQATQLLGKGVDPSLTPERLAEVYQTYLAGTNQKYPTEKMPIVQALSGKRTRVDDVEIHQSNAIISIEVCGTPVFDEQGNVVYAIAAFQDITERKQAEKLLADYNQTLEQQVTERTLLLSQEIEERQRVEIALRQSEEQRRLTMDFTHIGTWDWNIVENTVDWNDNHARLLGLVPGEVKSSYQAWRDRVHLEDIERVEQAVAKALATRTDFEAEYRVIYPDGSIHWLVGRGRGIYNQAGETARMLGVILDISERRYAALRDRKLAEAASILEERNRMAREIHDTLAQAFTGILLHIGVAIELITKKTETAQRHMETIDELARTGLTEARRSVSALRLKLLEEGDLFSALKHLTTQMKSSIDTHITCEIVGTVYSLPPDVENHLLRIGQEALTNAIKYAHATEIHLELVYEESQCLLRVKDDGQGFAVDQISLDKRFGLLGMSERAEHIGGELIVKSQPGLGTEIVVIVNRE